MPRNFIDYYAEPVAHGRSILRCDVVVNDRVALSYPIGSPAPTETVRKAERRVELARG